jgi:DNA-directed RNA polymerase subunit RPC12/RpoP
MRLINADALMEDIEQTVRFSCRDGVPSAEMRGANKVIDRIEVAPTISPDDVRGVGEWIECVDYDGDSYYECSACHTPFTFIDGTPELNDYHYCPNCGAKMGLEEEPNGTDNP